MEQQPCQPSRRVHCDRSRYRSRNRRGYTLRSGSGCLTIGVHLRHTTIQTSPIDAASFAATDYILLYSNKSVDTEVPAKHAGEVKQIVAVDPTTGVLTMDDQIFEAYTQAD